MERSCFMAEKVVLTYEGLQNLENELQELKTVRRKEVAENKRSQRTRGSF